MLNQLNFFIAFENIGEEYFSHRFHNLLDHPKPTTIKIPSNSNKCTQWNNVGDHFLWDLTGDKKTLTANKNQPEFIGREAQ